MIILLILLSKWIKYEKRFPPKHCCNRDEIVIGAKIKTFGSGWDKPGIIYTVTNISEHGFTASDGAHGIYYPFSMMKNPFHPMGDKFIEVS